MKFGFPTGKLIECSECGCSRKLLRAMRRNLKVSSECIEITALRSHELVEIVSESTDIWIDSLMASSIPPPISFHAPSRFESERDESNAIVHLWRLPEIWNIILHPDAINQWDGWKHFGSRLLIENMDLRKKCGQTISSMNKVFDRLPDASMCFDIGHARQIDPSMKLAQELHDQFYDKIKEIHISVVLEDGKHTNLDEKAVDDYCSVLKAEDHANTVVIIETPFNNMEQDLNFARKCFA